MKINLPHGLQDAGKENKMMAMIQIATVVTQIAPLKNKSWAQTSVIKSKKLNQLPKKKKEKEI